MGIKVSIVIPVFNGAENLQSCLAKLQEVITREVQIVIVDDGSTDASFIVASEFARNFENVTLHRIVGNRGIRKKQWLCDCVPRRKATMI